MSEEERDDILQESGMPAFRNLLVNYLVDTSGPAHLQEIMAPIYNLIGNCKLTISDNIAMESLSLETVKRDIERYEYVERLLIEKRKDLLDKLKESERAALKGAFANIDSDDLASYIRENSEELIKKSNIASDTQRHQIQQRWKDAVDAWIKLPGGLEVSWDRAWTNYQRDSVLYLKECISQTVKQKSEEPATSPHLENPKFDFLMESLSTFGDDIEKFAGLGQMVVGLANLGAGGGGMAGVAVALAPFAPFLIAGGVLVFSWGVWRNISNRKILRQEVMDYLPDYAEQTIKEFENQAEKRIKEYNGEVIRFVNDLVSSQRENLQILHKRLNEDDSDLQRIQKIILPPLKQLFDTCESLEREIQKFYSEPQLVEIHEEKNTADERRPISDTSLRLN